MVVSLLIRTLMLLGQDPTYMTSLNLRYLEVLSPNVATLGVRASAYGFWGDTNIQSVTMDDRNLSLGLYGLGYIENSQ